MKRFLAVLCVLCTLMCVWCTQAAAEDEDWLATPAKQAAEFKAKVDEYPLLKQQVELQTKILELKDAALAAQEHLTVLEKARGDYWEKRVGDIETAACKKVREARVFGFSTAGGAIALIGGIVLAPFTGGASLLIPVAVGAAGGGLTATLMPCGF